MTERYSHVFTGLVRVASDMALFDGYYDVDARACYDEVELRDGKMLFGGLQDGGGTLMEVKDPDGTGHSFTRIGHLNIEDEKGARHHFLTVDGRVRAHHMPFEGESRRFFMTNDMMRALLDEVQSR